MIPISTTKITVTRPSPTDEDYTDPGPRSVVATGVKAHISISRGSESSVGGEQEVVYFRLSCDPCDLDNMDEVLDEATGLVYLVEWARLRRGLGLDHVEANLRQVEGIVGAPAGGF